MISRVIHRFSPSQAGNVVQLEDLEDLQSAESPSLTPSGWANQRGEQRLVVNIPNSTANRVVSTATGFLMFTSSGVGEVQGSCRVLI